jgi:hypothetical protein
MTETEKNLLHKAIKKSNKNTSDIATNTQDIATNTSQLSSLTNQGQISGMVVLTTSEYAALEGTSTDGVLYLVTADPEE